MAYDKKLIEREYLARQFKNFLDTFKDNIIGDRANLLTNEKTLLVNAINELYELIVAGMEIVEVTYEDWVATYKYQATHPDLAVDRKIYRLTADYTDGTIVYHEGTIIFSNGYDGSNYKWCFMDDPNGTLGSVADLLTVSKNTTVAAINELFTYIKNQTPEKITYSVFCGNTVRYQEAYTEGEFTVKVYEIVDAFKDTNKVFSNEELYYQAGSIIYALGYKHITSPIDRDVYDWNILGNEAGIIGDMAMVDMRVKESSLVDTINHVLKDMEVTCEADTTDDTILKKYTIWQGIDVDTRVKVAEIDIPKDLVVTEGKVITADGTEVMGKDADGFDIFTTADEKYLVLTIANQEQPLYINVKDLVDIYIAEENAVKVQLAIDENNVISADIVPESIEKTDLNPDLQKIIDFIGFDLAWDASGAKQLTTMAETLRDAIIELDQKQGDLPLTTLGQELSTAINEHDAEIGDLPDLNTDDKTSLVNAANELLTKIELNAEDILKRLHLIASGTYADFQATYENNPALDANSTVIITDDFEVGGIEYKPGTWAYLFEKADGTKEWRYMNNGGGGDDIYIEVTALPADASPSQIKDIKTNAIYVVNTDGGAKNSYMYLKRSETDSTQNDWLLISSDSKGIEWIGSYNYTATETIIDPDTGAPTKNETPWEATDAQLEGISSWVLATLGRTPELNDLVTLTVDRAYFGQYLYRNNTWMEYSSLTKATKAQYGVTIFSTMDQYDLGTANVAIDPWLLKQILNGLLDDYYTKDETDDLLDEKVGYDYLIDQYYDKSTVDTKLKAIQKAFVVDEDPEAMDALKLEKYYGSLVYYRDRTAGTTSSYIVDSTGVIENLGESGVSLDGYVPTTDPKYLTLRDIRLVDATGNPQTVQQQLDKKLEDAIGAVSTVMQNNLIVNRAVISNSLGKITQSEVTANELMMLKGINTTDSVNKTIEKRLQALEAGGTGTGAVSPITFCTALPETYSADLYTIYRLTSTSGGYLPGYYAWTGSQYLRLDNVGGMVEVVDLPTIGDPTTLYKRITDATLHMWTSGTWKQIGEVTAGGAISAYINGVAVSGYQSSEQLKIVRELSLAEYNALTAVEKTNGTVYFITDDNTGGTAVSPDGSTVNVIDALNSTSGTDALSANQGYLLKSRIDMIETNAVMGVEDELTSFDTAKALSANQGRVLKNMIDNLSGGGPAVSIVNNLTTSGTGSALDASQGKELKRLIDEKTDAITALTNKVNDLENRVKDLEDMLAAMYSYDSTNKILTIKKQ